ncbi:coiled-coil domain-containing protein [Bdellovibrio svalbardensis]|uniref:Uncharacterized protein n=1 Tax=Bdellovibrio svalbardensis TaxID=2972972 RepID=A0ABT6DHT1_9BACT|nr:hypothetical protein [Bdellovibrio svalbardensis]MDG0815479.1 hypothetical protein [Bdellovibrio svalbardensis]
MMTTSVPEHEKLFDEICNKLNELSTNQSEEEVVPPQPKYEQMQVQMKKFHSDLKGSQEELREKIKTLENVSYGPATMDAQMQLLADQLSAERGNNAKLSADLAKSLELSLQLQLEIQGLKARAMQMQSEEKKYSQALFDKTRILQRDLDLNQALKEETAMELAKAKSAFAREQALWEEKQEQFENEIQSLKTSKHELEQTVEEMKETILQRDEKIESLNQEIEKISTAFSEVESSAAQQNDVLKNLMEVAEGKIIEMKMALDKKTLEAQDYYSHLQQALTQSGISKQENTALKEYVAKLNYYHQQAQQAQMAVAQMAQAAAQQVVQTQTSQG